MCARTRYGIVVAIAALAGPLGACEEVPQASIASSLTDAGAIRGVQPDRPPINRSQAEDVLGPADAGLGSKPAPTVDVEPEPAEPELPELEPCEAEGSRRCRTRAGSREMCTGGAWMDTEPCAEGSVCTTSEDGVDGACLSVAEVCQGSAGKAVCDGHGAMVLCGEDGVATGMTICPSLRHCQLGVAAGACATCVPGADDGFRCEGAELSQCTESGTGYELVETCDTAMLCNTVAGACTMSACSVDQTVCDDDVLQRCNTGQTGFDMLETCATDLCNATAGVCDVCIPGTADCADDGTAARCNADGSELPSVACPSKRPLCVGNGKCVECASNEDCELPGDCRVRYCNRATGTCEPQLADPSTPCSGGFRCSKGGKCVKCYGSANEDGNACGGCARLADSPGSACSNGLLGDCRASGRFECAGVDAVSCDAPSLAPRAARCGGGDEDCDGDSDETGTQNACGGCTTLSGSKGAKCDGSDADKCKDGKQVCATSDSLTCDDNSDSSKDTCNGEDDDCDGRTDENVTNACGGCSTLSGTKGAECDGSDADKCKDGKQVCATSNSLTCDDNSASLKETCDGQDEDCDNKTDEGNLCSGDAECLNGQCQVLCRNGRIDPGEDCDDDNNDDNDACSNECLWNEYNDCFGSSWCRPGFDCTAHHVDFPFCAPVCTDPAECSGGQVCFPALPAAPFGACLWLCDVSPCPSGWTCVDNYHCFPN